jgi:hypothetical protein
MGINKKNEGTPIIHLKRVPESVFNIISDRQNELKKDCKCVYSQERAIYNIINEWHELKKS